MTLKLNRIIEDLADPDREIQILALTTIPRIANDLAPSKEELDKLMEHLVRLSSSRNPDIVFLARKAQNTLQRLTGSEPVAAPAPAPIAAPPPQPPVPPAPAPAPAPVAPPVPASAGWGIGPGQESAAPPPPDEPDPDGDLFTPTAAHPAHGGPAEIAGMTADDILQRLARETDAGALASLLAAARAVHDPRMIERASPMLSHPDPRVRANAVEVFEELGAERHLPHLLPLLNDENNRVRSNAVKAVGKFALPQVTHSLASMLKSEMVSMRESGLYALSTLPEITDLDLVAHLVEDPYDSIRQRLVKYLAEQTAPEANALLEKLVHDTDAKVRDAALEALVKRNVSVDGLLESAAAHPEPPVPDPHVTPAGGLVIPPDVLGPPESGKGAPPSGAMVDEAVERGFRATLAQLLKELKSSEKRAILARALYQAGLKGYQACRRGELKDREALALYYEVDRYQVFLREYTKKLNLEDTNVDKLQRQIVVSGMAQYQGRLKVTLVKLGRLAAEYAKKGQLELNEELLREIETLAPPPPSGL